MEGGNGQDHDGVDPRLTQLDERLAKVRSDESIRTGRSKRGPGKGYSQGNRVLAELIGGLGGGALIGWLLDSWLRTTPWLLLLLMTLGVAAALRNIVRISSERPE